MSLGFVHACEQNHLNLSIIGGGGVVQLAAGKVVTCPVDPLFIYNYAFGVRLAYDAAGAAAAFKAAGRDYAHVLASPSSRPGLGDDLAGLGYRHTEDQAYRRTAGTGSGAPGLLELGDGDFDAFLEVWRDSWGADDKTDGREEAYRRRFRDPRSRPYRTADGGGVLLLFDSGTTTQLCHFAVRRSAQGRGVGRRVLELAAGLVPAGRPLWLFTAAGGSADRAAAGAGWDLDHTATDWILDLLKGPRRAAWTPRPRRHRRHRPGRRPRPLRAGAGPRGHPRGGDRPSRASTSCCSGPARPTSSWSPRSPPTARSAGSWPSGARASTTSATPSPTSPPPWPSCAPRGSR